MFPFRSLKKTPKPWVNTYSAPWLISAIFLVGINLRPALTSLGPVLPEVRSETGLNAWGASLLTTLPVLCLGLLAPPASRWGQHWGVERLLVGALLLLAVGTALRGMGGLYGLFVGTLMAGCAIGIAGTLLPGIVKRDFPRHAGPMTGLYTMALCLGGALAAGLTVPLAQGSGQSWERALSAWGLPALAAALLWLPLSRRTDRQQTGTARHRGLWRHPLAWQVTLYMGLQSSVAYMIFGWLPTILQSRGIPPLHAGFLLSASVMIQTLTALAGPSLAIRGRDQRATIMIMLALTTMGLAGVLYGSMMWAWLWITLLGLGMGGAFSIALVLIVLRAPNAEVAGDLSGMVQGIGYVLAALGPLILGLIPAYFGSWQWAGVPFGAALMGAAWAALGAGRNRHIHLDGPPATNS
ncbi:CynX/NimT family MFS transporter [Nitrosococcus watsonii]|uniref:Major facilitator superfamily MFS_1 n=1 Tax=Nitrosococcus watsoni (strain C-113) TaxID=105559 RepID=D8K6K4_NITWC|nr:MFS transporter [Nitrosococcus watsonii]ADJ28531.1 major facilitator superfamily MFS_1 [Nitrosococcus watsonii C-113]